MRPATFLPVCIFAVLSVWFACESPFAFGQADLTSPKGDREALLIQARETFAKAQEAVRDGKWGVGRRLHEKALALREQAYPIAQFPYGHTELADSLLATAESLLAFDLIKGEPIARQADSMVKTLEFPIGPRIGRARLLMARVDTLQEFHRPFQFQTNGKFAPDFHELDIIRRLGERDRGRAQNAWNAGFSGGPICSLTFVNRLKTPVTLHWANLDEWKAYGEVPANGGTATFPETRVGHLWLVKDHAGKLVAAFEAAAGDRRAVVDTPENMDKTVDPKLVPERSVRGLYWRIRINLEFADLHRTEYWIRTVDEVRRLTHPANHPEHARVLAAKATLARLQGDYEKALRSALEAERIWKTVGDGDACIESARALQEIGLAEYLLGKKEAAAKRFVEADKLRRRLSVDHEQGEPIGAFELAVAFHYAKRPEEAEKCGRLAINEVVRFLNRRAEQYSEVGQVVNLGYRVQSLLPYVDLGLAAKRSAAHIYEGVLEWKGIALDREIESRKTWHALKKSDPKVLALLEQLDETARKYVAAETALPNETAQKEHREQHLKARSEWIATMTALRQKQNEHYRNNPLPRITLSQLQAALPPDVALVEYVAYEDMTTRVSKLVAFVVTHRDIRMRQLGLWSEIYQGVPEFEKQLQRGRVDRRPSAPGAQLRDRLWKPIEQDLDGRKTILICPDSQLTHLTFAALPTADNKRYLIEDYVLVQITVAKQLPWLLADAPWRPSADATMLAVGDVDFGKLPPAPLQAAPIKLLGKMEMQGEWMRLPGTAAELEEIQSLFKSAFPKGRLQICRGLDASTARFREHSSRYEMLHLATHGYAQLSVDKAYPGTLAGIAFANANHPTERDSGFISSLEMKNFDFSGVRLVVLSACESGLGMVTTAGEGMLSAPRTLQIAGARSVIASNWKVDDEATRKLMERFYANYWNKNMSKVAALREAQLWMLNEGKSVLADSTIRGILRLDPHPAAESDDRRLPPSLWAAFVLHGDWR